MQHARVSLVLNLVGLREAVFDMLGYGEGDEGRATMYKVIRTATAVARKKAEGGRDEIRICMTEDEGSSRFASLDSEFHGKRSVSVPGSAPYGAGITIDAGAIGEHPEKDGPILEAGRLAAELNGGLLIDLRFQNGAGQDEIRAAIEKAAGILPFFRAVVI